MTRPTKVLVNSIMRSRGVRHWSALRALCTATAALFVVCGCTSTQPATTGPVTTISAFASPTAVANGHAPTKALVIIEENHSESETLEQMPYLAGLADEF